MGLQSGKEKSGERRKQKKGRKGRRKWWSVGIVGRCEVGAGRAEGTIDGR